MSLIKEPRVYHKSAKSGGTDVWGTPWALFRVLDSEFGFTLDASATSENAKLPRFFSPEEDGLAQSWEGERVFCNPPYSNVRHWVRKARLETRPGRDCLAVLLIPARPGSRWFWEYCASGEVRFFKRRVRFLLPDGSPAPSNAGFDSAIVIFEPGRGPVTRYWDWEKNSYLWDPAGPIGN